MAICQNFKLKHEDSENIKADHANTVVFNLHQIKRREFFSWDTQYVLYTDEKNSENSLECIQNIEAISKKELKNLSEKTLEFLGLDASFLRYCTSIS